MPMNRLNRDEILIRALDLADSPVLDAQDRPSGTIVAAAFSPGWLQEALDIFAKKFPFSQTLIEVAVSIPANTGSVSRSTITVPADYIQDYRNGILLDDDDGRLQRRSIDFLFGLSRGTGSSPVIGTPKLYAVVGATIYLHPQADVLYNGDLWYYQLPAVLGATTVPFFPDDHILVEYVWLKAQEWHRVIPPGSAFVFADKMIADLQKAGIGSEAEPDVIPLDKRIFGANIQEDRFVRVDTT